MRTIKFRGKRKGNAEWVCGNLLNGLEGDCYIIITHEEGVTKYEVNPDSVGQFTGLYDRNGKEIYEGDIIYTNYEMNAVVYWDKYSANFCISDEVGCNDLWDSFAKESEVVGNIHDNPEIMKGGNQ